MRFECHIVLDFNDLKHWVHNLWVRRFGVPQYHNGVLWGYEYHGCTYVAPER